MHPRMPRLTALRLEARSREGLPMPTARSREFEEALAARDSQRAWSAYEAALSSPSPLPISASDFGWLFAHSDVADAAVKRLSRDPVVRGHLSTLIGSFECLSLRNPNVRRVCRAATDVDSLMTLWGKWRHPTLAAIEKTELARGMIEMLADQAGRAWVRARVLGFWQTNSLLEEEQESIIETLAERGVLDVDLLRQLGPAAEVLAQRSLQRGRLDDYWSRRPAPPPIAGSQSSEGARRRIASLLDEMPLQADLRDAGIQWADTQRAWAGPWPDRRRLVDFLRHFGPFGRGEAEALAATAFSPRQPQQRAETFSIQVVRLLHLQHILAAPSLSSALAAPERLLLPEVFLYVLGQGGVSYIPELRIDPNNGRRWRARWAETTAEAVATAFLEDAVAMDLSTLARIPETKEPTPDFQATTRTKDPLVFETKGATNWETHKRQRKEARAQLRKDPSVPGKPDGSAPAWDLGGRAYACSLFASEQGAKRSSLFHVADPTFPFADLFSEGWENRARRNHYAALLDACEQYDLADYLLRRTREERPRQELEVFRLPFGEDGLRFIGRYDPLDQVARRVGHPTPERFRGIRVFRGLDAELHGALERTDSSLPEPAPAQVFPVGTVPGDAGVPQGVYSRLSNGAFLAVVAE